MLEELAKAYREACEEYEAAVAAARVLARQQDEAMKRINAAVDKREHALDALTKHARTQPAAVPPGSAQ